MYTKLLENTWVGHLINDRITFLQPSEKSIITVMHAHKNE